MKNIFSLAVLLLFFVNLFSQRHHVSYDESSPPNNGDIPVFDTALGHYDWKSSAFLTDTIIVDSWDKNTEQDDWNPSGFSANTGILMIDPTISGGGDLKGLTGTVDGHQLLICTLNGTSNMKLKKAQGSSFPANQFCNSDDVNVKAGACMTVVYYGGCWYTQKP